MIELFLLVGVVLAGLIGWRFHQQMIEQRLRDNPPERRIIEVSLPRDITDSNQRMEKFYRKVAMQAAHGDATTRKQGLRQLDVIYLIEVPGSTPELRYLIYSDPDRMDIVKRSVKQVFDGIADVIELKHDPIAEIAAQLRPPPAVEEEPETSGLSSEQEERIEQIAQRLATTEPDVATPSDLSTTQEAQIDRIAHRLTAGDESESV
jgi:hypothetical protein